MAYPQFHEGAKEFVVMTDASATGIDHLHVSKSIC